MQITSIFVNAVYRTPPLAPACNVYVIKSNLNTIFCKVTCSIRSIEVNCFESSITDTAQSQKSKTSSEDSGAAKGNGHRTRNPYLIKL